MYESVTTEAFYGMAKRNPRLTMQRLGNPAYIHYEPNMKIFFFEYIKGEGSAITTFNVYVDDVD